MKNLLIIGCGWVGKALKEALEPKFEVICIDKKNNNKNFKAKSVLIAIPAKGDYLKTLQSYAKLINQSSQVILLSSTSVYLKVKGEFSEESTKLNKQSLSFRAESLIKSTFKDAVILRLGGLMGYNRICGKYTANKKINDSKVNYIHRDDVVRILQLILEQNIKSKTYNLVAPIHPKHSQISAKNAKIFGFNATIYNSLKPLDRVILSNKVINELNYTFLKPNPLEFWN